MIGTEWKTTRLICLGAAAALLACAPSAQAAPILLNGGFETNGGNGQIGFNTTATGWTVGTSNPGSAGLDMLYTSAASAMAGATSQFGSLGLWTAAASPNGGSFLAVDGDPGFGQPILTTVTGLVPGDLYAIDFFWAGAQQSGFFGPTNERWSVSLGGGPAQLTPIVNVPSQGFSGWLPQSFTFTAPSASSVLSFLAVGGPGGLPPFVLLDGVSIRELTTGPPSAVPEPGTVGLMVTGLVGLVGFARRRQRRTRS